MPVLRDADVAVEAARGGGGWGHVASAAGRGFRLKWRRGRRGTGACRATAADVGEGDAAELGGGLFPGNGEGAVCIVRPGGCDHAGQRRDGHSRLT